ncbi:MAG: diphosphomevalonate decarboxylase [Deltaproteobacteria bacterium]|nr:diphosphomevalonate decarboxylase [Deltaproteobacteria bacterium]
MRAVMTDTYIAKVPTNIAFLKYWGKSNEREQWPANDSLSMTLDLYTETLVQVWEGPEHCFSFAGLELPPDAPFAQKPLMYLDFLGKNLGFKEKLFIRSHNDFPASCGIASSASGLGALTLSALACWTRSDSFEALEEKGYTRGAIASLARYGSGSACRSFWGGFVRWYRGVSVDQQTVSQIFPATHWALRDRIVILSAERKSLSSTDGHKLAWTSPLFAKRLAVLEERGKRIEDALARKDLSRLGPLLEEEALEMHEVMKQSRPPCVYLGEDTHRFLDTLRKVRQQEHLACYFTLDAGPNVHLIYEEKDSRNVDPLTKGLRYLDVGVGAGPQLSCKQR